MRAQSESLACDFFITKKWAKIGSISVFNLGPNTLKWKLTDQNEFLLVI